MRSLRAMIKPAIKPLLAVRLAGEPWKGIPDGSPPVDSELLADCLASLLTSAETPWPWWPEDEFPHLVRLHVARLCLAPPHRPWPFLDAVERGVKACEDWPAVYRSLERYRDRLAPMGQLP